MLFGPTVKVVVARGERHPVSVAVSVWRLVLAYDSPFDRAYVAALCVECGVDELKSWALASSILSAAKRRRLAKFNPRSRTWTLTRKIGDQHG